MNPDFALSHTLNGNSFMVGIDLTGKTVVITGGNRGLGAATARRLHEAGASVAVNHFPDETGELAGEARALVAELGEDRAFAAPADVRDPGQLDAACDAVIERFGRLDVLVNNAGILRDRTLKKMDSSEWRDVIDTNLTGVFNACRSAAARMHDGGRIVSLSSIAAFAGFFGQSNYAAAKAGVVGLTRVLSRELARRRITVNAVAPGVVLTSMGKSIPEDVREQMLAQVPLGRFGEPADIADAILFLSSDLARYITGQTLHVNGGWLS